MCSLRHSPIPSAPSSRARVASSGGVGVGPHAERAQLVGPLEHGLEGVAHLGLLELDVVGGDHARAAVDDDGVAFAELGVAHANPLGHQVDLELARTGHARLAHPAGHQRGVAGLSAPAREDADRGVEARHVLGLGERADQDDPAVVLSGGHGVVGGEDDLPLGGPGGRGHARGQRLETRVAGEGAVQQRVEPRRLDGADRPRAVEQALLHGIDREADGRLRGPLGVAGLEHVERALLDGELGVLHVLVVALERAQDLHQLFVGLRHRVLHVVQVVRCAHARNHVLTLGVGQEVA